MWGKDGSRETSVETIVIIFQRKDDDLDQCGNREGWSDSTY